jgi:hypothetical protein
MLNVELVPEVVIIVPSPDTIITPEPFGVAAPVLPSRATTAPELEKGAH